MEWNRKLQKAIWTGYGVGRASNTLVPLLHQCYTELSNVQVEHDTLTKLQYFHGSMSPQQDLKQSPCYHAVSTRLRDSISRLKNGTTVDRDGREITFENFTNYLVEEESDWIEQLPDGRTVGQVRSNSTANARANSNANANSTSGNNQQPAYNKETGEPLHRYIFAIDVSVLYRNVSQVDDDEYKHLPNVVKKYFRDNPNKNMPKKFDKMDKPKPKPKNVVQLQTQEEEE